MLEKLRQGLGRSIGVLLAVAVAGALAGCPRGDRTDQPPVAPAESRLSLEQLIETVSAGDGAGTVRDWIAWRQPYGEAYSFVEYPSEFGAGRAYYWGDWQTRTGEYCAVRMQPDYTPVQVDFTLGWFAGLTGREVAAVRSEFLALHDQYQGDLQPNPSEAERIGEIFTFVTPEAVARLFTDDSRAEENWIFAMMLPAGQVAKVVARNDPYPELAEFATVNQPATLLELVDLLRERGAGGVLGHFDFSAFKRSKWHAPLDGSGERDYRRATIYLHGSLAWDDPGTCYLAAFDDGARVEVLFTAAWYGAYAGYGADELAAAFDALHAQHGGTVLKLDAANDAYDMQFAYADLGGVTIVRRRYVNPPHAGHEHYVLWAGAPLFADAPVAFPAWGATELPPLRDEAGKLERFVHEVASTPMPELRALRLYGFVHEEWPRKLHQVSPFTMLSTLKLTEITTQRQLCHAEVLDETWLDFIEFRPVWFCEQSGATQGGLEGEFAALLARYGGTRTTDAAGTEPARPADARSFTYGPLTVGHIPGGSEDGSEDWYRIDLPTWP